MGSFAAHKDNGDMTNKTTKARRGTIAMKKKNHKDPDAFDLDFANIKRQQTQLRGRKSIMIPRMAQAAPDQ